MFRRFLNQGRFAYLEADEARDRDVFTQLGDRRFNQIAYRSGVFANEGLFVKTNLFVELLQAAFHDLIHHLFRLAFLQGPPALDVFFFIQQFSRYILLADELRVGGRDLHGEILHQTLEVVRARHEIGLAVHFH